MKGLAETILEYCRDLPEGIVLSPREFSYLGSGAVVSKVFSRLAMSEQLYRICRGLYVVPVVTRFGKRPPATDKVVSSLALRDREVIVPSGARAAYAFGLTRQVPVRDIFITTGRPRTLQLGGFRIEIKQVPHWQLALGASEAGDAIRALAWIGKPHAQGAAAKLRKCLPSHEWTSLMSAGSLLPDWMVGAISSASDNPLGTVNHKH